MYLYTREHTHACTYQQRHVGCPPYTPRTPPIAALTPRSSPPPWPRASRAPRPRAVTGLLLAEPRPAPGVSQSLAPSAGPHQPPHASPHCTRQNRHHPAALSISEGPALWDVPVCPKTGGNQQCGRTCTSRVLLGGGMEEHRQRERGAWGWPGSAHMLLGIASGYSTPRYPSSRRATPRLCYSVQNKAVLSISSAATALCAA